MMDKHKLIQLCLNFDGAIETYPFDEDNVVIRHKANNKWFALIFYLNNKLCVNLKSEPLDSVFLRELYDEIKPAWHMNKTHWIMVEVDTIDEELLCNLIKKSYELTILKKRKK